MLSYSIYKALSGHLYCMYIYVLLDFDVVYHQCRARELSSLSNTGAAGAQSCHGNGAGPLLLVNNKTPSLAVVSTFHGFFQVRLLSKSTRIILTTVFDISPTCN